MTRLGRLDNNQCQHPGWDCRVSQEVAVGRNWVESPQISPYHFLHLHEHVSIVISLKFLVEKRHSRSKYHLACCLPFTGLCGEWWAVRRRPSSLCSGMAGPRHMGCGRIYSQPTALPEPLLHTDSPPTERWADVSFQDKSKGLVSLCDSRSHTAMQLRSVSLSSHFP